jgi:hypothetical protein
MTLSRRGFAVLLPAALLWLPALVLAASKPWDDKAFRAAQAEGRPILVDVYARW